MPSPFVQNPGARYLSRSILATLSLGSLPPGTTRQFSRRTSFLYGGSVVFGELVNTARFVPIRFGMRYGVLDLFADGRWKNPPPRIIPPPPPDP